MKKHKSAFVTLSLIASIVCSAANAAPVYLGEAGKFNAYILDNMTGRNSDVEGRLAVGGSLDLVNYGVGLELPVDQQTDVVVVGDNATLRNARIYNGNAVAGGTIDIDETVGLYNGENTADAGTFYQGSPFDFASMNEELTYKSSLWGAYTATSQALITGDETNVWNISFSASDSFNVFSIDASILSSPDKSITLDVPASSYNLINVYGESIDLFNTGFHYADGSKFTDNQPGVYRHDGAVANNFLFNFVDATELNLYNIGFKGSILAPLASTTFWNGHIDGNLIVKNLSSPQGQATGQVNNYRFGHFDISEPATRAIILLALLSVFLYRRMPLKREPANLRLA